MRERALRAIQVNIRARMERIGKWNYKQRRTTTCASHRPRQLRSHTDWHLRSAEPLLVMPISAHRRPRAHTHAGQCHLCACIAVQMPYDTRWPRSAFSSLLTVEFEASFKFGSLFSRIGVSASHSFLCFCCAFCAACMRFGTKFVVSSPLC